MAADARRALLIAFILSLAGSWVSYIAAGATLGLLIGSVTFTALVTPPLALVVSQSAARPLVALAATAGSFVVWIFAIPIVDSLQCALVLFAFTLAVLALRSPAIAVIVAIGWLSVPFWMDSQRVASLVAYHPIFAMNGACKWLGVWTQQPILYRLSTLGQDVPYQLPTSIWRCVIAHGIIGLALLWPVRNRSTVDDERADPQTRSTPPPASQAAHTP